ncbi:Swi3-domain-containing protein [Hesseltinella vesiculosa]|uniref:Chromosome segregation in meiosis protein n=1 Tax=Hesseltinella vesiculosa TaxID=101127 RepID=A0A1X2G9Q6_9FUNG|nr:Swi3-domain-containing protein [Hesseltinella vesiculosa]
MDEFDDLLLDSYDPFENENDNAAAAASNRDDNATADPNGLKRGFPDDTPTDDKDGPGKKQRTPIKKLDHAVLFAADGLPRIKNEAQWIKFQGKGHETEDLRKLMEYYRLWARQIYPKLNFQDFCRRAFKACASKPCKNELNTWREEYIVKNTPADDRVSDSIHTLSLQDQDHQASRSESDASDDKDDDEDIFAALRAPKTMDQQEQINDLFDQDIGRLKDADQPMHNPSRPTERPPRTIPSDSDDDEPLFSEAPKKRLAALPLAVDDFFSDDD